MSEEEEYPTLQAQHEFLNAARRYDFLTVIGLVTNCPALVNAQPAGRWSALHQAAQAGNVEAVRFLVSHGANVNALTKDGQTPSDVAKSSRVKELLGNPEKASEPQQQDKAVGGQTPKRVTSTESFGTPRTPSMDILSRKKSKDRRSLKDYVRKPRNLVAAGILGVMLSRAIYNHVTDMNRVNELMAPFDRGQDQLLNSSELTTLLGANGMEMSNDQVRKLFGFLDDEGNGFDSEEVQQIVGMIAGLPAVSERLRRTYTSTWSVCLDVLLCAISGMGLVYLVSQHDQLEKKWAGSSFRNAVQYRRMQKQCSDLDSKAESLASERQRLEKEIKTTEEKSFSELEERNKMLGELGNKLKEVQQRQKDTQSQKDTEVAKWQREASASLNEAKLTKMKMERMMLCIKGLDAFTGTGTGNFASHGAQQGFSQQIKGKSVGFSLDTITFGTIEDGQLLMYETANSRKLGEGKDCAYRCTDLTKGDELALKMYKITNHEQRRAIFNDLYAYRSQAVKHKRIVSYERVIESANMIFVLMELIAGKDLFDTVVAQQLTEEHTRPLLVELVEGLQHLHNNGVIHCDVKPENIMVTGSITDGTAHLKLIDFGCSCFTKYESDVQGCMVYDQYLPPEHSANPGVAPTVATDMWRLGCTLYVMLLRSPPFRDDAHTKEGRRIRESGGFFKTPAWEKSSDEAKDLIRSLMNGDPAQRPTCQQVLEHPFITGKSRQEGTGAA